MRGRPVPRPLPCVRLLPAVLVRRADVSTHACNRVRTTACVFQQREAASHVMKSSLRLCFDPPPSFMAGRNDRTVAKRRNGGTRRAPSTRQQDPGRRRRAKGVGDARRLPQRASVGSCRLTSGRVGCGHARFRSPVDVRDELVTVRFHGNRSMNVAQNKKRGRGMLRLHDLDQGGPK